MINDQIERKKTKEIYVGNLGIGGKHPVSVQSMTNTDTRDISATLGQIKELYDAGCELVRVAVPDIEAAEAIAEISKRSPLPVIADIHYDYRLAIRSIESNVHGLRINPGNIGSRARIKEIVKLAEIYDLPIRIGVNSGSVEKKLLDKYGGPTSDALVESAMNHIKYMEDLGYSKIKISIKSSNVQIMLTSYRKISKLIEYPLHIGVTEAGFGDSGVIKSAIGIGTLLAEGIGDTIRVSLTGNPVNEIGVALKILRALNLRQQAINIISCPTCGRCQIDLFSLATKVEKMTENINIPLTIAVMGCIVNGPGEAKEADIGIAGGKGKGLIFVKGKIVNTVSEDKLLNELWTEILKIKEEKKGNKNVF